MVEIPNGIEEAGALVPGRQCGACSACCTELEIRSTAFSKAAGTSCVHLAKGCAIYAARPEPCRAFFCGWRLMPQLGDDWRPDRSGVLIRTEDKADGSGIAYFLLVGGPEVSRNPNLARVIAGMISAGITAFIAVPGRDGRPPAKVELNGGLQRAIAGNDLEATIRGITAATRTAIKRLQSGDTGSDQVSH